MQNNIKLFTQKNNLQNLYTPYDDTTTCDNYLHLIVAQQTFFQEKN